MLDLLVRVDPRGSHVQPAHRHDPAHGRGHAHRRCRRVQLLSAPPNDQSDSPRDPTPPPLIAPRVRLASIQLSLSPHQSLERPPTFLLAQPSACQPTPPVPSAHDNTTAFMPGPTRHPPLRRAPAFTDTSIMYRPRAYPSLGTLLMITAALQPFLSSLSRHLRPAAALTASDRLPARRLVGGRNCHALRGSSVRLGGAQGVSVCT